MRLAEIPATPSPYFDPRVPLCPRMATPFHQPYFPFVRAKIAPAGTSRHGGSIAPGKKSAFPHAPEARVGSVRISYFSFARSDRWSSSRSERRADPLANERAHALFLVPSDDLPGDSKVMHGARWSGKSIGAERRCARRPMALGHQRCRVGRRSDATGLAATSRRAWRAHRQWEVVGG